MLTIRFELAEGESVADQGRSVWSAAVTVPVDACYGDVRLALDNALECLSQLMATRCDFLDARPRSTLQIESPIVECQVAVSNNGGPPVRLKITKGMVPG
jgi:hypothetical protein